MIDFSSQHVWKPFFGLVALQRKLLVEYFERFECKYSPQARWVPSLLFHKHISEPGGTSEKGHVCCHECISIQPHKITHY